MPKLNFEAVIFDLDGVITDTAAVHSMSWKQMFDGFLLSHSERENLTFQEFTHADDYLPYVDGKPRYKGVADFLASRGIALPYGDPSDQPQKESVCGLGNRKNQLFNEEIAGENVTVFQSTVDFIYRLKEHGMRIGVASSSKNCKAVLEAVGILGLFETRVDGAVSAELGLRGKPEPDIFTVACDILGVSYNRTVIVEDAVSGVQAGKNGGFGLVLGIARDGNEDELRANGADMVISDMSEIDIKGINEWFEKHDT